MFDIGRALMIYLIFDSNMYFGDRLDLLFGYEPVRWGASINWQASILKFRYITKHDKEDAQ